MDYWSGDMNWPLRAGWVCDTCGEYHGLTWGFVHSQCRCNQCHTMYWMRDFQKDKDNPPIVDVPINGLKDVYRKGAIFGWKAFHSPIDEWDDLKWDKALEGANY